MPLQNRVYPYGAIFRSPARGTLMGNRGGALHNDRREILRQFKNRRWIACVLEFRGRWRSVMSPGRYTELFFLDEAVAFAAGHRPCAECRHARYIAFRDAWMRRDPSSGTPSANDIDAELQKARIDRQGRKVTYQAPLDSLPNGCFVYIDSFDSALLVWDDALFCWSPARYVSRYSRPIHVTVTVLTPQPIVQCFRNGYRPQVHDSVLALNHCESV